MVLVVLSALFAIGLISARHVRNRAKVALFYEDIRRTKEAATHFAQDCGFMPPDVYRGVDPALVKIDGYKDGGHSSKWSLAEPELKRCWKGPYLKKWKRNPWGGLYDWDNYPPSYTAWGIPGGGCYLTLKPSEWGGENGLPDADFEDILEKQGTDKSLQNWVVAVWMGKSPDYGIPGQ